MRVLDALEARPGTRDDERPEAHASVPDDDRQVCGAPPGPGRADRRVDDVVGHHHGELGIRVGDGHRSAPRRRRARDRDALAREQLGDRVRQGPGAVHLDPGQRFRQDVDDRG
ncbi:hypothetical protein BIV01_09835 [Curtobacterium sp. MCBA15_013]|nr:hypothetical protein BIV01_09835 [Curtobacterium sp. MCBA15_013]